MSRRSRQPRRCASRRLLLGARLAGARRVAVRWRFQPSRTPRGGGLLRDAPRELAALLEPLRADAPVGRRELVFLRFFFAIALAMLSHSVGDYLPALGATAEHGWLETAGAGVCNGHPPPALCVVCFLRYVSRSRRRAAASRS